MHKTRKTSDAPQAKQLLAVKMGAFNLSNTLQALTIAAILWTGTSIVDVTKTVAIHEWRITKIEQIEHQK